MIEPESIPLFTGDLGQLEQHVDALGLQADGIRQAGGAAHRRFQGLSAFYRAPEAEDLFASTAPARDAADGFADKVAVVAEALRTYAAEVAPIAAKLEHLKERATVFVAGLRTSGGAFDEDWTDDADKVQQHQALMHEVNVAKEAFTAAEIACHNRITALVGGTQYVMNTGAKQLRPLDAEFYGYSADVLDQAEELPWGTPVSQSHDWWDPDDYGYYAKSFLWDGLIIDNVVGTVDGLATLAGVKGWAQSKQSWEGLARVVVGAVAYSVEADTDEPAAVFSSDYVQGSKVYAKEFAKSFVAWDMWQENPARAAATVVFNGLTLGAGPLRIAAAGRAGTGAKVATAIANVGDAIDPIAASVRVTSHGIPKIAQITESLRGVGRLPELSAPHSVLEFSDGAGRSVLVVEDGRFVVVRDGEVVAGTPIRERSLAEDLSQARQREPTGVGASSHAPEVRAHVDDGATPRSGHETAGSGDTPSGTNRDIPGGTESAYSHGSGRSGSESTTPGGNGHPRGSGGSGEVHAAEHQGADGGEIQADDGARHDAVHGQGSDGNHGHADGDPPAPHGSSPGGEGLPMVRGGETEQRIREAIKGVPGKQRPTPNVLDRVLARLATESDGQRIAEIIGSGRFNQSDGYGQVVSSLSAKRTQMFRPGADQLMFADDLVKSGVPGHTIDFEQKYPPGADMDIRIADESGDVYAYQMKRLNDPQDPVSEITRGKYLLQLAKSEADHHVMLVDGGRGTLADWMANGSYDALMDIHGGARGPKGEGITFVIRLEDGNLVVPPGSKLDPKDML
ncbi:hypothetical protein ACFV6E_14390 [Streptomyces sp. NPDC059785]|uniref:hypothetical protein n=1 Tax=Streptomyces sp. NPDC059785 TaxID=3346945 RepID=UPI003663CBDD